MAKRTTARPFPQADEKNVYTQRSVIFYYIYHAFFFFIILMDREREGPPPHPPFIWRCRRMR